MLSNERFALACRAYYDKIGLVVDATNGEFAHSPLTRHECDTGYYLLHSDHQHQGLLQSRDLGKCCFFAGHVKRWLGEHDDFSEDFSELWNIYWEYSGDNSRKILGKLHEAKNAEGKSLHALKLHEVKNGEGKSLVGVRAMERFHQEKDENGKSLHSLKINAQIWESTVDGFRGNAGNVAYHNKANGWDPAARVRIS
jgi:hypothetical protein